MPFSLPPPPSLRQNAADLHVAKLKKNRFFALIATELQQIYLNFAEKSPVHETTLPLSTPNFNLRPDNGRRATAPSPSSGRAMLEQHRELGSGAQARYRGMPLCTLPVVPLRPAAVQLLPADGASDHLPVTTLGGHIARCLYFLEQGAACSR